MFTKFNVVKSFILWASIFYEVKVERIEIPPNAFLLFFKFATFFSGSISQAKYLYHVPFWCNGKCYLIWIEAQLLIKPGCFTNLLLHDLECSYFKLNLCDHDLVLFITPWLTFLLPTLIVGTINVFLAFINMRSWQHGPHDMHIAKSHMTSLIGHHAFTWHYLSGLSHNKLFEFL